MHRMTYWLVGSLIQWACSLLVCLPFTAVAIWQAWLDRRQLDWPALARLALFLLISLAMARSEQAWVVKSPWQGMVLETAWALVFIVMTRSAVEAGLTFRISPRAWRDALLATGLLVVFVVVRNAALRFTGLGQAPAGRVPFEYLLYQLTMPGIAEELGYRGVIQSGLNASFGRPWRVLGAQVGWGWVITSVVFWAPHAFRVDPQMQLSFYWPTLTMQLVVGFALGWMRERTASVFPPMLAHNLVNVCWIWG